VGAAFVAAVAFVTFLTGWPALLVDSVALVLLVAAIAVVWRRRPVFRAADPSSIGPLIGLSLLGYTHLLAIQTLLPQYVGGQWLGDWHHHYLGARVFSGLEPVDRQWGGAGTYTVASRTPLYNLAAAGVMELAGDEFCVYQTAVSFLSACIFPVIYVLLHELFDQRTARLGVLLASLNIWLLHIAWFTWPKMLAAAYILMALHFYLYSLKVRLIEPHRSRRFLLYSWMSAILGYMTHQVAVAYLLVLVLHALVSAFRERKLLLAWREVGAVLLTASIVLAPWYGWLLYRFGPGGTTSSTPTSQMDPQFAAAHGLAKVAYVAASIVVNFGNSLVPITLIRDYADGWSSPDDFYRLATDVYFNLLPGALTTSMCLYLILRFATSLSRGTAHESVKKSLAMPQWSAVWSFALIGGLGAAALHPLRSPNGIAHSAVFPTTVVLLILGLSVLGQAQRSIRMLVCAGMLAEFLGMFWSHVLLLEPLLLDAYNPVIKADNHLVFLHDCVGSAAVALVVTVQAVLVLHLAWALSRLDKCLAPHVNRGVKRSAPV
jgi:hypothetical protein